jgi:O-antigen/teichoic acid export membrane protein
MPIDLSSENPKIVQIPTRLRLWQPERIRRLARVTSVFFVGQGALQGINFVAALFLLRSLSVSEYAQFSLANAFQMTITSLMDLGIAGTMIPLIGEEPHNTDRAGRYVRAAKHLRDRTFLAFGPVAIIAFLATMHGQHWSWQVQTMLVLAVLLGLYSSGPISYYSAPLLFYGKLKEFYLPQTLSGVGKLCGYFAMRLVGALNSWTAAGLNAVALSLSALLLGKVSRRLIAWPSYPDPVYTKQVFRYVLPAIPAIIFSSFQVQITLILVAVFGKTANIAQVAALGRISQLFLIFTTFNMVIVEPRVARLERSRLPGVYFRLIGAGILFCVPVTLLGFLFPTPYVWILGSKYAELTNVIGIVVFTACVMYMANLIWIVNRARRWLFWHGTVLEIVITVMANAAYITIVGLRTTRQAVLFSLISSVCALAIHIYISVYGFWHGSRMVRGD